MSKSYKRTPVIQDKYGCKTNKWYRRQASKAVRRYTGYIAKGASYKKIFCSWIISDYSTYEPWNIYTKEKYDSKKDWAKYYYYK